MQTQVGRDRARENRLGSARGHRLRLNPEQFAVKDVVRLTGLDQATVRRLRQTRADCNEDLDARARSFQ